MSNYAEYAQPPWNYPNRVEHAIDSVRNANSEASAYAAYHEVLYAVGNNHAGTYCSVAVPVVAELLRTLTGSKPWAQFAAIEAMIDLTGSFKHEISGFLISFPKGSAAIPIEQALVEQVASSAQALAAIAASGGLAAESAKSLLEVLG